MAANSLTDALTASIQGDSMQSRRIRAARPEPSASPVSMPFISADDHLVEPPDTFVGRLPRRYEQLTPRLVPAEDGADYWQFDDKRIAIGGANAIISWPVDDWYNGPIAIEDARRGTWDIDARIEDMNVNGVVASLCFPSMVFGFAGQLFMRLDDPEFGFAAMQAYNQWILEAWAGPYPDRIIPCQVAWLLDPVRAATEIRRNAERGFKAVAFSENPAPLGLPPITDPHWDPFFAACEETGTVINLHTGSSSDTIIPFWLAVNGMAAAIEWLLYGKVALRFPDIRIVIAEGGIGWVPMLRDRLRYRHRYEKMPDDQVNWPADEPLPEDVLHRNFWYTSYYDPNALLQRSDIGVDRIMFESDYPHADSSWPDSQQFFIDQMVGFTADEVESVTLRNASELYRHPVTAEALAAVGGSGARR